MNVITVNNKAYQVKKTFPNHQIDDMELLSEVKGRWGADSIINQKSTGIIYLVETIKDAEILEEWVDGEPVKAIETKESGSSE